MGKRQNYRGRKRTVNRKYKDRLFVDLFSDKENALSLYNALRGTAYADPEAIEITTLKDVLYLSMKNDVAICFANEMSLFEHQSSDNPNMPLRGLMYFGRLYGAWVANHRLDIYGSRLIKIPSPVYYVLYNGEKDLPERKDYLLSDAFEHASPGYEWTAHLININPGKNRDLLESCPALEGYSRLTGYVRENAKDGMEITEAVDKAIDKCIDEGYLEDYLISHREEVRGMILTRYDKKLHNKTLREEGREEGRREGREEGRREERVNTEKERKRAEKAEAEVQKLKELLARAQVHV